MTFKVSSFRKNPGLQFEELGSVLASSKHLWQGRSISSSCFEICVYEMNIMFPVFLTGLSWELNKTLDVEVWKLKGKSLKYLSGRNTVINVWFSHGERIRKVIPLSSWWQKYRIYKQGQYSVGLNLREVLWGSLRNLSYETWVLFGAYQECFMRGKESRGQLCHGIFLAFFHSPKLCAGAFLAVYYWQRKCWFMGLSYRKPCFLVKKQACQCCQLSPLPGSATCPASGPAPRLTEGVGPTQA